MEHNVDKKPDNNGTKKTSRINRVRLFICQMWYISIKEKKTQIYLLI